ncbi:hypothetical protein AA309_11905 [Microvirga vignae]|uniref:DUF2946 domain-containing protein n=1 Tax=Microvirga vignae TaxID=1225564 RepID=A0A0H1RCK7_9HYPH|nr:hypothetical protein [Microvirga vignae]KLK92940.1 hypothetical protein AA309_11905 [Microvirga vignae]
MAMLVPRHVAGWARKATAFISALVLALHILLIALGAGRATDGAMENASIHAAHMAQATDHNADMPEGGMTHKVPCCIFGAHPGLPPSPTGYASWLWPRIESHILAFQHPTEAAANIVLFRPIGPRAPPAAA